MQQSTFFVFRCCFFFIRSNTLKHKLKKQIHFVLKCYYWYVYFDKRTLESVWMFSCRLSSYHNILFFAQILVNFYWCLQTELCYAHHRQRRVLLWFRWETTWNMRLLMSWKWFAMFLLVFSMIPFVYLQRRNIVQIKPIAIFGEFHNKF